MNEKSPRGARDPILKALAILRRFMEEPTRQFGVRETAADMQLSPSSAHRLLNALAANGFISREEGGSFCLSADAIRLSNLVVSRIPVQDIALRHLTVLSRLCNELVFFGNYSPDRQEIYFSTNIESTQNLRYVVKTNTWVPIYSGASGLAVMAFLPAKEREAIIKRTKLAPLTERTIVRQDELEEFLAGVRQSGYAYTHGQRITGAVGIAAPVFDSRDRVIGSIALSVPEQRFQESDRERFAHAVMSCAASVTRELGGTVAERPGAGLQLEPLCN